MYTVFKKNPKKPHFLMQKNYSVELKNYSVVCIKKHTPYNDKMENNK